MFHVKHRAVRRRLLLAVEMDTSAKDQRFGPDETPGVR